MDQQSTAPQARCYLVLGARGALGTAVGAALRHDGHRVVELDRPEIDLDVRGVLAERVEALWHEAGPFDGLVHAAGLFPAAAALDTSEEMFDRLLAVNARSALVAASTVARLCLADDRPASMVVVSSGAAARPQLGTLAYAASKAALEAVVRGLALELGPSGIRVNAVAPGFIDVRSDVNPIPREYVDALAANAPQGRVATVDDIVPSIMWLLSDGSHWLNGQALTTDGGASLGGVNRPTWLTRTT
jgi:3-oxoacyl-[acyl-carrier protein] reductase